MSMQSPPSPSYGQPDGGPAPYGPPASRGTNTMAVLALVFAFVFSPLGIVFGIIGRRQVARTGESGRGLATAGLVLGIVFVLGGIVLAVVIGVAAATMAPTPGGSPVSAPVPAVVQPPAGQPAAGQPAAGATTLALPPESVASQIEGQTGGRASDAVCPQPLPAQVGASITCTATVDGAERDVTATVTAVQDGSVAFDITG